MNKTNFSRLFKNVGASMRKNSPVIMTAIGIAGMTSTVVLAVKATPKALEKIEEKKQEKWVDDLSPMETVTATWKCYIPAAVTGVASAACLIGANSINTKRNVALAAAYKISETALSEYREKVIETFGEKKDQLIREKVAEKHVQEGSVNSTNVIFTGNGDTKCVDIMSGQYFMSNIDKVKKAENEVNKQMLEEGYVSLNDFYDYLNIEHTGFGDLLGWNLDDGLISLQYSSHLTPEGVPCLAIQYGVPPKYEYDRFM